MSGLLFSFGCGKDEPIQNAVIEQQKEETAEKTEQTSVETPKDMEQTEGNAADKPKSMEPQKTNEEEEELRCTISISCGTLLENQDMLHAEKAELIPSDGWILRPIEVTFTDGENVFHVLKRICQEQKIHLEFMDMPLYNSAYIEGIHNLYEFDAGPLSGWMYRVNGWFPNYGCSRYQLMDGDRIEWVYTCDLGNDVGGGNSAQWDTAE